MDVQSIKRRYGIVGNSEELDRAIDTALRVANTDLSVLIEGESGVGKDAISQIIHEMSKRKHESIISINCGAIPEGTINSELFGHEKGAFTGATSDRKGYFETANKGSIFLDEIGEMPLDTQAYLLRVLENGEFIKVGSSQVVKTDVRIIAATNANLINKINAGKFREDLYYRLNTVPIKLPALYERREDIYLLFRKFASDFSGKYRTDPVRLTEDAQRLIANYRWPGNIRELKNFVEQLSVLSENKLLDTQELLQINPRLNHRNLPSKITEESKNSETSFEEREILYKVLFDMKSDLTDLKNLVYALIKSNNLSVPDIRQIQSLTQSQEKSPMYKVESESAPQGKYQPINLGENQSIYLDDFQQNGPYGDMEEVEESLSLEEMIVEMIQKALKKHKGRRKDAAEELGISERTLYRKIKEHEIQL